MLKVIGGIVGVVYGIMLSILRFKKHKTIDTKSVAEVKEIRKLGMDEGRKVYAIFYTVKTDEPFEICRTPVRRREKIGTQKIIYFDSNDHKNYYFQKFKSFDYRLIFPVVITICGLFVLTYSIVSLF